MTSFLNSMIGGKAPEELVQERLSTCEVCKEMTKDKDGRYTDEPLFRIIDGARYCGEPWVSLPYRDQDKDGCGCNVDAKVKWSDAECPRGRWGKESAQATATKEFAPAGAESRDMSRGMTVPSTIADFDLYMQRVGFSVCYWNNPSSGTGGLTLNQDANPSCADSPGPPEIISGGPYTTPETFYAWYSQNDACSLAQNADIATVYVVNNGTSNITVNGNVINPGNNYIIIPGPSGGINFDSFGTKDQSGFGSSGTPIIIDEGPVCWTLTARRENGNYFREHGPGRYPTRLSVPADVDLSTVELVDDGILIESSRYRVSHEGRQ